MVKVKNTPAKALLPKADANGWLLCVGDSVTVVAKGAGNRAYVGRTGSLEEFCKAEDRFAPVLTCYVGLVPTGNKPATRVLFACTDLQWNGTGTGEQPSMTGDRVRIVYARADRQEKEHNGRLGTVLRFDSNDPFPALVKVALDGDSTRPAEECTFEITDMVRAFGASPVAEATPAPITSADIEEAASTPTATTAPVYTPTKMKLVALADIIVTSNTRKVFDETALAELADSIKAQGVIAPITVRPHGTEAGKFELVAGERRYRASKLAEQVTIPAVIRTLTDREFLEIQLLENLQRVDVRPADEASAFAKLLGSNFSAEEIAQRVGKPVKFVLQRAKLITLIPFWMELLEADRLPLVAAHELARLPAHSQVVVRKEIDGTWEFTQGKVLDPRTIHSTIASKVLRKLDQVAWALDDATLYVEAGPCTTCPKRSGACRGLFDDLQQDGKPDTCLDAACFAKKMELFVQRRRVEFAGTDIPMLSGSSWDSKGGVIGFGYYNKAEEGEKGAVLGLVVDGSEAGKTRWVKIKTANSGAKDSKAEREASIRKNRIARQANELKADLLRELFTNQLSGKGDAGIHALLNHFIKHSLEYGRSRTPNAMLEYLQVQYGWEQHTEADLNTQTIPGQTWLDGDLNTPHRAYLVRQLAKMPLVVDKILLYFDLKFRSGLEQSEVLQVQDTLIKRLPTSYQNEFDVTAKATKMVEERYYTKKGKKQEATV